MYLHLLRSVPYFYVMYVLITTIPRTSHLLLHTDCTVPTYQGVQYFRINTNRGMYSSVLSIMKVL